MTNYKCFICDGKIPSSEIPKEAKQKIGLQIFWHEKCDTENKFNGVLF